MPSSKPASTGVGRSALAATCVLVGAALLGTWGCRSWSSVAERTPVTSPSPPDTARPSVSSVPPPPRVVPMRASAGADGQLPDGATVLRDDLPGVANLDPALLAALRRAAIDASADHVALTLNSGWRARSYQQELLDQAIGRYGSAEAAARWVAPPDRSAHVSGDAVDVDREAASWLSRHGASYGLCRTYDNEPWHYELRPDAVDHGCPARYPDAAHDPRMQP